MTATTEAKKLLEAATGKWCKEGHPECANRPHPWATREIREQAPATLAAAITMAEALKHRHMTGPHGIEKECRQCKALAEWEALFPETQRPANGGVDEAKADHVE